MTSRSLVLALALALVAGRAVHAAPAAEVRLGHDVVPTFQHIRLHLDPDKRTYSGGVRVDLDVRRPTTLVQLHADGQRLTRVTLLQGGDTIAVQRAGWAGATDAFGAFAARWDRTMPDDPLTPWRVLGAMAER